jgi:hypothetical protein
MSIGAWEVELHGTLRGGLWKRLDRNIDDVQRSAFYKGSVRTWMDGNTQVFLPHQDEDVVFVFSHILQHFYKEGIGIRQICDWCRLLYTYRDELDISLLESRLIKMNIVSEWRAFGSVAVDYLGMPKEAMPFYSSKNCWKRKANRVLFFILKTGNFGHNRDYSYCKKYPYLVYKIISACKHIIDAFEYLRIFPIHTIKVTSRRLRIGLLVTMRGGKHE